MWVCRVPPCNPTFASSNPGNQVYRFGNLEVPDVEDHVSRFQTYWFPNPEGSNLPGFNLTRSQSHQGLNLQNDALRAGTYWVSNPLGLTLGRIQIY